METVILWTLGTMILALFAVAFAMLVRIAWDEISGGGPERAGLGVPPEMRGMTADELAAVYTAEELRAVELHTEYHEWVVRSALRIREATDALERARREEEN